jgi:chromosome segregation ATPase
VPPVHPSTTLLEGWIPIFEEGYTLFRRKEAILCPSFHLIEHHFRQIEEITKNHLADLEATKKHFEDRLKESFNFKNDLDKMRIAYDKVKEEKVQLEQKQSQEKIQKLDEELQNVRSAFDEERRRLEEEIKKAKTKNTELEKSNREYSNAYAKMEKEIAGNSRSDSLEWNFINLKLLEMKKSMNAMKKTHEQKLEDLSKKNQEALRKEKENNEKLRKELNDENEKLKKQLAEAYVEMEDLRSQIRPIGYFFKIYRVAQKSSFFIFWDPKIYFPKNNP